MLHCTATWQPSHTWALTPFLPDCLCLQFFFLLLISWMWRLNYTLDLFLSTVSFVELVYPHVFKRNPPVPTPPQLNSHTSRGYCLFLRGHFALHSSSLPLCYLDPECFPSSVLESPEKPPISFHFLHSPKATPIICSRILTRVLSVKAEVWIGTKQRPETKIT